MESVSPFPVSRLLGAVPQAENPEDPAVRALVRAAVFPEATTPTRIGRFVIVRMLGAGGMGVVYLGKDEALDRLVAVKLLAADRPDAPMVHARLRREAKIMARLNHPNVVSVYEFGEHEGRLFVAMEYVEGRTLGRWLADEAPSWQTILEVFVQAGRGLMAAHAASIIHRDFKPSNVLVGADGRVRVADFGLAHAGISEPITEPSFPSASELAIDVRTLTGQRLGTLAYMSPEQFRGQPVDARSDQFSFCVALWEALHGTRPYPARTSGELERMFDEGVITSGSRRVPRWLDEVVARGLALEADSRWPSMEALVDRLAGGPLRRRGRRVGAALALAITGLGVGVAGYSLADTNAGVGKESAELVPERAASRPMTSAAPDSPRSLAPTASRASRRVYADFNNDGYEDLAVPVPFEDVEGDVDAGAVSVIYGSADGLTVTGDQIWHLEKVFLNGHDKLDIDAGFDQFLFGHRVAAGDFDGDGYADLAIGVPGATAADEQSDDESDRVRAGAIVILYGSASGLTNADAELITQGLFADGVGGDGDRFGSHLVVGDFNTDGRADLAVAAESKDHGSGAVFVIYGATFGLSRSPEQGPILGEVWTQDSPGIEELREADDRFGSALAVADFDGDGGDDLAIGARGEDIGGVENAGVVHILRSSPEGLTASGNELVHADSPRAGEQFGFSLAAGDFSGDGLGDLAVGIPHQADGAGAVAVFYSPLRHDGASPVEVERWSQSSTGIDDEPERDDHFGWDLSCGDFDGNGRLDLAIGVPGEDLDEIADAGAVVILYDDGDRLGRPELWSQESPGVQGRAESDDHFGARLGAGDFDGDGDDELVVAIPDEDVDGHVDSGGIQVFEGTPEGVSSTDAWWDQGVYGTEGTKEHHDRFGGDY